jgi:hypothetical protein
MTVSRRAAVLWRKYRFAGGVVCAALLAAAWVALFVVGPALVDAETWRQLGPADRVAMGTGFRSMLAQVGLGLGALGAVVYTARTFQLSRESQVVERFSKAVDQLGSDKVDVRLGGIFGLERVMADSLRDHETVVHVLAAFVGEHAPCPRDEDPDTYVPTWEWLAPPMPGSVSGTNHWRPAADIRAVLAVLGRRPPRAERNRVDLTNADLRGADLGGSSLQHVNLSNSDLREIHGTEADLQGAQLGLTDLRSSILVNSNLRGSWLEGAYLRGALLFGAQLRDADLTSANLEGARLDGARLHGANLIGTRLGDVDLRSTDGLTLEQLAHAIVNERTQLPNGLEQARG